MITTITPVKIFSDKEGNLSRDLERLEVQLESIKKQDCSQKIQSIIVDASEFKISKKIKEICKKYSAKYIKVNSSLFFNKPLLLNNGIVRSQGKFLCILDMDIYIKNNVFSKSLNAMKNSDIIVGTTYKVLKEEENYFDFENLELEKTTNKLGYAEGGFIFLKKEDIVNIGLYDTEFDLWGGPDNDITARFKMLGKNINRDLFDNNPSILHIPHKFRFSFDLDEGIVEENNNYNKERFRMLIKGGLDVVQNNTTFEEDIRGTRISNGIIKYKYSKDPEGVTTLESREEIQKIINLLKRKENFAISRYGDGELGILMNIEIAETKGGVSFFPQNKTHQKFRSLIQDSIKHSQKNYIKGVPCGCCWTHPTLVQAALNMVTNDEITLANVFMNGNSKRIPEIVKLLEGRNIILTCNWNAVAVQNPRVPLNIRYCFRAKGNSLENMHLIQEISDFIGKHKLKNYVFLFCAGPLSNVLVQKLFQKFPDNTYIDIGSVFDPMFYGKTTRWYQEKGNPFGDKFCKLKFAKE